MGALCAQGNAFNQTRQTCLATDLSLADTHWTRFRGLLGLSADDFGNGSGLWITPCRGVHTLGMAFAIDVIYLDRALKVVGVQSAVKPWRFTPVRFSAASVLELPCHTAATTKTEVGDTIVITLSKDRPLPR
jgi:uncharacterized membrane protein (UPF0127 family)